MSKSDGIFTEELSGVAGLRSLTVDGRENGNRTIRENGSAFSVHRRLSQERAMRSIQLNLTWLENRFLRRTFQSRILSLAGPARGVRSDAVTPGIICRAHWRC
jgi:hypothetical protein